MNPLLLLIPLAAGGAFLYYKNAGESDPNAMPVLDVPQNQMGLPDIRPENQGGVYKRDYDDVFFQVAQEKQVPFALLKAHAVRESALKPQAFRQEPSGKASYGLMQILWWKNSNRFADWGYDDDAIGDGSLLYDPLINTRIASEIIIDNWNRMHNLRDIINAYNTGVKESKRVAPGNYVGDVLNYYSTLVGERVG